MSNANSDTPMYYPEDYDYSIYYQNELKKYQTPVYKASTPRSRIKNPMLFPTLNYLNERKCPIYVHNIKNDSSVHNQYNQKLSTSRKPVENQKPAPQNASKLVLDKLEETYWATWKPKKGNTTLHKAKAPSKVANLVLSDVRPIFQEHNDVPQKEFNRPHGDVSDNIIKYFKAKHFDSTSTTDLVAEEMNQKKSNNLFQKQSEITKLQRDIISNKTASDSIEDKRNKRINRPSNSRGFKVSKQDPISQEIQTEVHCPVILKESEEESKEENTVDSQHNEDWNLGNSEETNKPAKTIKLKGKVKKQLKQGKLSKKEKAITKKQEVQETNDTAENLTTFVEHKDSIELTKKKQEKLGPREHFQQPKCIRLYRKSGLAASYIKGGTYPLKSCLKKEGSPKGNFRLGAPGSPLFVTTSSFSNKRRK